MPKPIPEGYHSLTPVFVFKDARKAIDFYECAFGAKERFTMPGPDGKGIAHAEIIIGDSIMMMGEESPQQPCKSAETLGTSPVNIYHYVPDADKAFRRALEAGAQALMPVQEMFWGDRMGSVRDPFGYTWMIAEHAKDLTLEEIRQRAEAELAWKEGK